MELQTFTQVVQQLNEQLSFEPIQFLTLQEEEAIIKIAINAFKEQCGEVPEFYVESGPHGMVEVVLGTR